MDTLSIELLVNVSRYLDMHSLTSFIRTAKRYNLTLTEKLYDLAAQRDAEGLEKPMFILRAAEQGNTNVFKKLLRRTEDINKPNIPIDVRTGCLGACPCYGYYARDFRHYFIPRSDTLLHVLLDLLDEEMIKLTLEMGADPLVHNSQGFTVMHFASTHDKFAPILRLLIDTGADLDVETISNRVDQPRPVHIAIKEGCWLAFNLLVEAGADLGSPMQLDPSSDVGTRSLAAACNSGDCAILKRVIDDHQRKGPRLNYHLMNRDGQTTLHMVAASNTDFRRCRNTKLECVKTIIDSGCDVNAQDTSGQTALHMLYENLEYDNGEVTQYLIDAGIDISIQSIWGDSPLRGALQQGGWGNFPAAQVLVNAGILQYVDREEMQYTLLSGIQHGLPQLVTQAVKAGADVNLDARGDTDDPPLHLAACRCFRRDLLLDDDSRYCRLLSHLVRDYQAPFQEIGGEQHLVDWWENPPEPCRILLCLLNAGADISLKDFSGKTAFDAVKQVAGDGILWDVMLEDLKKPQSEGQAEYNFLRWVDKGNEEVFDGLADMFS